MASRADAVAKMNPIKDSTEAVVCSFCDLTHRVQPQIRVVGETRYPNAIRTANITRVEMLMLNVQVPLEHCKPAQGGAAALSLLLRAGVPTRPQRRMIRFTSLHP
jgi:hypothetical protein